MNERSTVQAGSKANGQSPLLQAEHVQLYFPIKYGLLVDRTVGVVHAVDDVSLTLAEGQTLGIVGESGCGKSTLARCMVRLLEPTGGTLRFRGRDITHLSRRPLQPFRREVQLVFQDPSSSLNPRKRVGQIVATPMLLQGVQREAARARVRELLDRVGLNPEHVNRFPHEFSGGQRQRIGVARALAVNPKLIVLDEPVSALDVSVQAQVVNLLDDLQDDLGLSYGRPRPVLRVHRPRPVGSPARLGPDRGHVPRQGDGAVARRGTVSQADTSVHRGPAVGDTDPGPAGEPCA